MRVIALSLAVNAALSASLNGQQIVKAETNAAWMFADGDVKSDVSPFTISYQVDTAAATITRVSLFNTRTQQQNTDNTKYVILSKLFTHSMSALTLGPPSSSSVRSYEPLVFRVPTRLRS